jgi:hypothetical protein
MSNSESNTTLESLYLYTRVVKLSTIRHYFLVDEPCTLDTEESETSSDEALSGLADTVLRDRFAAVILAGIGVDHMTLGTKVSDDCGRVSDIEPSRDLLGSELFTLLESGDELGRLSITHNVYSPSCVAHCHCLDSTTTMKICQQLFLEDVNYSPVFINGTNT